MCDWYGKLPVLRADLYRYTSSYIGAPGEMDHCSPRNLRILDMFQLVDKHHPRYAGPPAPSQCKIPCLKRKLGYDPPHPLYPPSPTDRLQTTPTNANQRCTCRGIVWRAWVGNWHLGNLECACQVWWAGVLGSDLWPTHSIPSL